MLLRHHKLEKHFFRELLILKINLSKIIKKISNILLNQKKGSIDHDKLKIKMKLIYGKEENTIEMHHQLNFLKERNFS